MASGRSPRTRAQLPQRQLRFIDNDQQVGGFDLVVMNQLRHSLAAFVHERQRFGQQAYDSFGPPPSGNEGTSWGRQEIDACPPRDFFDHRETDVVSSAPILRARIPETNDRFHELRIYSFSSSAFAMMAWTTIMSPPLIPFHFPPAAISRTRIP